MKTKSVKYTQAVDRNLGHLKIKMERSPTSPFLAPLSLEQLRIKTGIRKTDTSHDGELSNFLDKHKAMVEKSGSNVKKKALEETKQKLADHLDSEIFGTLGTNLLTAMDHEKPSKKKGKPRNNN